jgi:hypothetical protein
VIRPADFSAPCSSTYSTYSRINGNANANANGNSNIDFARSSGKNPSMLPRLAVVVGLTARMRSAPAGPVGGFNL